MTRARDLAAFVSNADGDIKFDTDTLFIDSSANKVGIRTNTPPHPLSVFGTGAGNATVQIEGESGADPTINFLANNAQHWAIGVDDSDSDTFKISEHSALGTNDYLNIDVNGNVGIKTTSPISALDLSGGADGTPQTITFAQGNASSKAAAIVGVYGDTNSQGIKFLTNSFGQAERLRILPAGGITFNGDTAAANALNDYEEGTWTPAFASGSVTLQANSAFYIKIGKLVHAGCRLANPTDVSSTGIVTLTGLPFTINASYYNNNIGSVWGNKMGSANSFYIYSGASSTSCSFYYGASGSSSYSPVRYNSLYTDTNMMMRFHYMST